MFLVQKWTKAYENTNEDLGRTYKGAYEFIISEYRYFNPTLNMSIGIYEL